MCNKFCWWKWLLPPPKFTKCIEKNIGAPIKRDLSTLRKINEQMNTGCHPTQPKMNFIIYPVPWGRKNAPGKGTERESWTNEQGKNLPQSFPLPQEESVPNYACFQEGFPWEWEVLLRFLSYVQSLLRLEPISQTHSLVAPLLFLPREPCSNY